MIVLHDFFGQPPRCLYFSYDPNYDTIQGDWLNQNPYMVIHRIALASSTLGQNKTKEMIDFVFNHFKTKDIRIDTHPKKHTYD